MHPNDIKALATNLGLSLEEFNKLLESANYAYQKITELGPFYGQEDVAEPTFRISAEAVPLPKGAKKLLDQLGNDLLSVGRAITKLPPFYRELLGANLEFAIPPTWRIDAILDVRGRIKMNELEGVDSASALMMAEQLAYKLQDPKDSTAAYLAPTIKAMANKSKSEKCRIGLIRVNVATNPHTPNARRFIESLQAHSKGTLKIDLFDEEEIRAGKVKPDWSKYDGVINETLISPKELDKLKISQTRIISSGNYNAIGNKGVFALIFEDKLKEFWEEEIDKDALKRLQKILIPTYFIHTQAELEQAKNEGKVVKVYYAASDMVLLNRSKGVAIPEGDIEQSSEERWEFLKGLLDQEVRIVAQDYIKPATIKAFLRKKGTNLEKVKWYNRLCVKYVCTDDPNAEKAPLVMLTGAEITLGPDIIPSGRRCVFTAGKFVD